MNADPFAWLENDTDLEWSMRETDGSWLLVSRAVFARRSGMANDERIIRAFLTWAQVPRNGKHYCLASDTEQSPDNAMAESFFATLKLELMEGASYATQDLCRQAVFEYMEIFYNRMRMHSSLNYRSAAQAENEYVASASVS